jgi:hypothetical protein
VFKAWEDRGITVGGFQMGSGIIRCLSSKRRVHNQKEKGGSRITAFRKTEIKETFKWCTFSSKGKNPSEHKDIPGLSRRKYSYLLHIFLFYTLLDCA